MASRAMTTLGQLEIHPVDLRPRRRLRKDVVRFINEYEEERVIHRDNRGRLTLKRRATTRAQALSRAIGEWVGDKVRAERKARGWSMAELADRAGLIPPSKHRVYEIEKAMSGGLKVGTIYLLAAALEIPVAHLLPSVHEAFMMASQPEEP